ncbi:MAG: acetolactate synthase, partial [Cephaloticoccus sp.]
DDTDKAREIMVNNDFPYVECEILVVEVPDEAHLKGVLAALLEAEINLHYIYTFLKRPGSKLALAINVEEPETAAQALNGRGFKVLTHRDIAR